LTHATAGAYARYYTYDPFGNLKTVAGTGGPNPNYTLNYAQNGTTAPATNRLLSVTENGATQGFTYDNAGNLTSGDGMTYAYDAANRLKEVNNGVLGQYGYDGEGLRVKKVEGGATVYYVRSGVLGQVAFEVTSASVQRAYVYTEGKLVAQQTPDGQFQWLHTNHLNSGRALTDVNGSLTYKEQFDPHGQTLFEWSATGNPDLNTKKFTGYERDAATGLDYANARTYTGNRGRFLQPDPSGLRAACLARPESLNRYTYVVNDPVNYIDITGLSFISWLKGLLKHLSGDGSSSASGLGLGDAHVDMLLDGGGMGDGGSDYPGDGPCEIAQIQCFRRCFNSPAPWPMKKGDMWHYRYCESKCLAEYMACKAAEVGSRLVTTIFETLAAATAWLRDHPEVVVGTVLVVAGVAYIVATGGSGALILIPAL
jgi:RHS repeat-associated protein